MLNNCIYYCITYVRSKFKLTISFQLFSLDWRMNRRLPKCQDTCKCEVWFLGRHSWNNSGFGDLTTLSYSLSRFLSSQLKFIVGKKKYFPKPYENQIGKSTFPFLNSEFWLKPQIILKVELTSMFILHSAQECTKNIYTICQVHTFRFLALRQKTT